MIPDEAGRAAVGAMDKAVDEVLRVIALHAGNLPSREVARLALEAAVGFAPTLKTEWGVRYDTHVDWIERPAAGEAWAKVIFKENQDEGAVAVVRRQVSEWEVVDLG